MVTSLWFSGYEGHTKFKHCTFEDIHTDEFFQHESLGGLRFEGCTFRDIGTKVEAYLPQEDEPSSMTSVFANPFFTRREEEDESITDWEKLLK